MSDEHTDGTVQVKTTLVDVVQNAAWNAKIDGNVRLESVEVTDKKLANVTLHIRPVQTDTDQSGDTDD